MCKFVSRIYSFMHDMVFALLPYYTCLVDDRLTPSIYFYTMYEIWRNVLN